MISQRKTLEEKTTREVFESEQEIKKQLTTLENQILELKGNLKDRNKQIDILQTLLDRQKEETEKEKEDIYSALSEHSEAEGPEMRTLKARVKRMGTELDQKIERIQQLEKRGLDHVRDAQCTDLFIIYLYVYGTQAIRVDFPVDKNVLKEEIKFPLENVWPNGPTHILL